jgi:hypothetical protein
MYFVPKRLILIGGNRRVPKSHARVTHCPQNEFAAVLMPSLAPRRNP